MSIGTRVILRRKKRHNNLFRTNKRLNGVYNVRWHLGYKRSYWNIYRSKGSYFCLLCPSIWPKIDLGTFRVTVVSFKGTFRPLNSINFNSVFFLDIVDRLNVLKLKQYWVLMNHRLHEKQSNLVAFLLRLSISYWITLNSFENPRTVLE